MFTKNGLYKKIDEAMNATRNKTQKKETIGKQLLEDSNLLNQWFKNNKGYEWVEDKDTQLSGVDYFLTTARDNKEAIDLKVGIGRDYERIAVEYEQYTEMYGCWKRTFTDDKRTNFLLFVNVSTQLEKVSFILVDYKYIVNQINAVEKGEKTIFDQSVPNKSFNETGYYFTIDLNKCKECRSMLVEEMSFDDLTKSRKASKCAMEKILEEL